MPSPFPGKDPYLEGSACSSFHAALIAEMARQLAPELRPKYLARPERRVVLDAVDETESLELLSASLNPDMGVSERKPRPDDDATAVHSSGGTIAIAPAPVELLTVMPARAHQWSLRIIDVGRRRLVTAIELLSPGNKSVARRQYLKRRRRFLESPAHLLEIDLLRKGRRVPMRGVLPEAAYFVFLSRAHRRPRTEVWPIALRQPIPPVPVPLLPGDADVPLDLEAAVGNVYDELGFDLELDYKNPPDVPPAPPDAAWAVELSALKNR